MIVGVIFGLVACMLWGCTYLLPLYLSTYDPLYLALARAVVMGAVAFIGIFFQRDKLYLIEKIDWQKAFWLTLVGNVIQCWFLLLSVEFGGAVLAGVCFGITPVSIALIANERERRRGKSHLPLSQIVVPVFCILFGLVLANWTELALSVRSFHSPLRFSLGLMFGLISTAMWTWYPIRNADWLLAHPKVSPVLWTNVQCVLLLPIGVVLYGITFYMKADMPCLFGGSPTRFVASILFVGVFCSWGATSLWNCMSQRVPTSLVGQMLIFETLFSIVFAHIYDLRWPSVQLIIGLGLMAGSIVYSLRKFDLLKTG